jgi:nitrite reductase (NADH) small subunit
VQGRAIACPLHGWVIELDNGRAEPPDEGCTQTVSVRRVGDRILLVLPATHGAAAPHWEAL